MTIDRPPQYKKAKKLNPQNHLTEAKRQFLTSTLKVIVQKMKWDSDTSQDEEEFEDMDDDERAAFEKMRHVSIGTSLSAQALPDLRNVGPSQPFGLHSYDRRRARDGRCTLDRPEHFV